MNYRRNCMILLLQIKPEDEALTRNDFDPVDLCSDEEE